MDDYLNKGIKEIINEFPETGTILSDVDIGCASCNVGTCLLKDIVEVHNLPYQKERALMMRISRIIYPDHEVEIPRIERKAPAGNGEIQYSPLMRSLVHEHAVIKKLLSRIPLIIGSLDVTREDDRQLVLGVVDFIRSYADRYHHAKEEDILFKEFDGEPEIIRAMHEEHSIGRGHVKAVLEALRTGDTPLIVEHLTAYGQLLTEHIRKEDKILYPWMDRNLSTSRVGELFARFVETDNSFCDTASKHEEFVRSLERKFNQDEAA